MTTTLAETVRLFTCRACLRLFRMTRLSPNRCPFCGSDRIEKQGRA